MNSNLNKAIFLDRDGVINFDSGYVYKLSDLVILPGVDEALKKIHQAHFLPIVITNQSGVARGMYTLNDVDSFHQEMSQRLKESSGVDVADYYTCPHHPKYSVACPCRKPGTALLEQAAKDHQIDLSRSFMIGDKVSDIDCAINAKLAAGLQVYKNQKKTDDFKAHPKVTQVFKGVLEAVEFISQNFSC